MFLNIKCLGKNKCKKFKQFILRFIKKIGLLIFRSVYLRIKKKILKYVQKCNLQQIDNIRSWNRYTLLIILLFMLGKCTQNFTSKDFTYKLGFLRRGTYCLFYRLFVRIRLVFILNRNKYTQIILFVLNILTQVN